MSGSGKSVGSKSERKKRKRARVVKERERQEGGSGKRAGAARALVVFKIESKGEKNFFEFETYARLNSELQKPI